jgi:uncharacterized protein YeaO (DUF488 family)
MRIKLRRACDPPEPGEQLRVLVDRLCPRGVAKNSVAPWLKELERNPEAVTECAVPGMARYGARDRKWNQPVVLKKFLRSK